MSNHVVVSRWVDIESARGLDSIAKQRVATIFSEQSWDYVVWIPEWLLDEDGDRDIQTVENSDCLAVGDVVDYSAKAWALRQRHVSGEDIEYLPKSQVVVFERASGVDEIQTPQAGLDAFAGGRR